jgi:hypothetical protein
MQDQKVYIESSADLFKLPISTIQNTKLYNFKGKYFDKIYEEALKIEKSGKSAENFDQPDLVVERMEFHIPFNTQFGQKIGVVGSTEELGKWVGNNG